METMEARQHSDRIYLPTAGLAVWVVVDQILLEAGVAAFCRLHLALPEDRQEQHKVTQASLHIHLAALLEAAMLPPVLQAVPLVLVAVAVVQDAKPMHWLVAVRIRAALAVAVLVEFQMHQQLLLALLAGLQRGQSAVVVLPGRRLQTPQVPEEMAELEQHRKSAAAEAVAVDLLLAMAALVVLAVCMLAAAAALEQQQAQTLALVAMAALASVVFMFGKD
jgi:hypothetical protein